MLSILRGFPFLTKKRFQPLPSNSNAVNCSFRMRWSKRWQCLNNSHTMTRTHSGLFHERWIQMDVPGRISSFRLSCCASSVRPSGYQLVDAFFFVVQQLKSYGKRQKRTVKSCNALLVSETLKFISVCSERRRII